MIIVYHKKTKITEVVTLDNRKIEFDNEVSIGHSLHKLALQFPDKKIVWCSLNCKENLNLEALNLIFHHNKMMLSYLPQSNNFFDTKIGYIEESLFININKKVAYPTWQMSSVVGIIHASILNAIQDKIVCNGDFDYYLSSIAKLCMPLGLLCYSEPKLLKEQELIHTRKANVYTLFQFVKQHYKTRWVFLLLLNFILYERKFPVWPFLLSFFYKNRSNANINLDHIKVQSTNKVINKGTLDVIVPTIGRKEHLHAILLDLKSQSLLPTNVIIVEQNPQPNSESDLDFIVLESWPFAIKHTFTHQMGVCNARNIALTQITSEWIFFADDDIRIGKDFIQKILEGIEKAGVKAVSISCLQKGEVPTFKTVFQWGSFGSGCSFVAKESLKDCKFLMGYEYGFGEDADFGKQLRNQGYDVLFLPQPEILHLKAPIGGFRTKPVLQWQNESVQPKPSPTVMLYLILHNSQEQLCGYKTILFFKYYKYQKIKNAIRYFINFEKQWDKSVFWANELKKQS